MAKKTVAELLSQKVTSEQLFPMLVSGEVDASTFQEYMNVLLNSARISGADDKVNMVWVDSDNLLCIRHKGKKFRLSRPVMFAIGWASEKEEFKKVDWATLAEKRPNKRTKVVGQAEEESEDIEEEEETEVAEATPVETK